MKKLEYRIVFKKTVAKDLKRIDKKESKNILDDLEDKEFPQMAEKCPDLKGKYAGLKKYRIGNYHIIFAILGDEFLILCIAHRKDVYI